MEHTKLIEILGGTTKLAKLCEVSAAAVSQWKRNGIPYAQIKFLREVRKDVFKNLPREEKRIFTDKKRGNK